MEEPRAEDIQEPLDELEEQHGTQESLPPPREETDRALQQCPNSHASVGGNAKPISPTETYAKMLKETRSWGLWSLGLGILHLALSGLSGPWGIVLLVVGLASFVFRETAMFVVYGTILAWVALGNMLSGDIWWILFAVFQLILAFVVFRQYTRFRRAEKALDSLPGPQRASRAFPQLGCALGALALLGLIIIFAVAVFLNLAEITGVESLFLWLENLVIGMAVLGLAAAVASLLSGYRHKPLAILGIVASALVLSLELAFALFS